MTTSAARRLSAVSKKDGRLYWISDYTGSLENPIINDGDIFIRNSGNSIYIISMQNGNTIDQLLVRQNSPLNTDPTRSPAIVNNLLIVPFADSRLFAYQLNGL